MKLTEQQEVIEEEFKEKRLQDRRIAPPRSTSAGTLNAESPFRRGLDEDRRSDASLATVIRYRIAILNLLSDRKEQAELIRRLVGVVRNPPCMDTRCPNANCQAVYALLKELGGSNG